jgi:hypothetical protein
MDHPLDPCMLIKVLLEIRGPETAMRSSNIHNILTGEKRTGLGKG